MFTGYCQAYYYDVVYRIRERIDDIIPPIPSQKSDVPLSPYLYKVDIMLRSDVGLQEGVAVAIDLQRRRFVKAREEPIDF
jgi:hypothetical protein